MSLTRRIIFTLFVTLAAVCGIWAYLHLKSSKKPEINALSVLPDSCVVYLNTSDFFELNKKINSQNLLVDKLKQFLEVNAFCNTLQSFDSLLSVNEEVQAQLKNNQLHFALYGKNLNWLLAFNIKHLGEQSFIEEKFSEIFRAEKQENEVYSFHLNKNKKIFFTLNAGVVLLSDTPQLLEAAFNAATAKLIKSKNFIAFKSTLEESSPLNIFINHKNYTRSEAREHIAFNDPFVEDFSVGNVDFQPSQITVNGFLSRGRKDFYSALKEQETREGDFTNVLPLGTISFGAFGFDNFLNLKKSASDTTLLNILHQNFWQNVNDSALYDVEKEFYQNMIENVVNFETQQKFVLAKVEDHEKALEHLQYMSDSILDENSETIFCLKKLSDSPKHQMRLFHPASAYITQYATLYGNLLYFSENKSDLFQMLRDIKNGNVMDKNASFVLYKNQHFPEKFNFLIYNSPNLIKENKLLFNFKINSETTPYESIKHFCYSEISSGNKFRFRWNVSHESEVQDKNTLWTLNLKNPCQTKPFGFLNHKTKENELVVQDETNVLYLINAKGTVLWKKQLDEKIISPIYMVDALKNNKYQMLFGTKTELHLIDRTGKYLNNYPAKLPAEATSPLALLDYDNDKDYRLLIACKNKTIYNYAISGIKQEHFSAVKTDHEVNMPVQYVKVGLSDYLVTIDKEGKIYTFSRKGVGRVGLKNRVVSDCRAFYVDATNNINSTFIFYVDDKNGLINKISFTDKKEIIKLNNNIHDADIQFENVSNDRNTDIIITTTNNLMIYSLNGNLLFEKTRSTKNSAITKFYSDMTHSLFMTWNGAQQELIVFDQINQSEKTHKATALPLVSNLFNNNKKYLIIANGRQVSCQSVD